MTEESFLYNEQNIENAHGKLLTFQFYRSLSPMMLAVSSMDIRS